MPSDIDLQQLNTNGRAGPRMSDFDPGPLVALLSDSCDAPPRSVRAIQQHGLLALTTGRAASVTELSHKSSLTVDEIRTGVTSLASAGRIETDGEKVIGASGLTLTETDHAVKLPNATMHTWCALDAIGIPVALELDAEISTTCLHCDERLHVTVRDGELSGADSLRLFCPTGQCDDVRAEFCSAANLFCSPDHLRAWKTSRPSVEGHELDLTATAELGRALWGHYASGPEGGIARV